MVIYLFNRRAFLNKNITRVALINEGINKLEGALFPITFEDLTIRTLFLPDDKQIDSPSSFEILYN